MADKQEVKYQPKYFRQWQGEGVPDPEGYLFKNKSRLISTAVFCELMAERMKELTHHHCGKTLIPDVAGGLIDTPIDDVPIRLRIKSRAIDTRIFCFDISDFPINQPATWEFASNDASDRTPVQMAWKRRKVSGEESTTIVIETPDNRIELFSETRFDTIQSKETGVYDETKTGMATGKRITTPKVDGVLIPQGVDEESWGVDPMDGKYYKTTIERFHRRLENGSYETESQSMVKTETAPIPFNPWQVYADVVLPDSDVLLDSWEESAPRIKREVSRNGIHQDENNAAITTEVEQFIKREWKLEGKWDVPSLFNACKSMIDTDLAREFAVQERASVDTVVAYFSTSSGESATFVPEEIFDLTYLQSEIAPVLDARFDDGDFIVERKLSHKGIDDTRLGRLAFRNLTKYPLTTVRNLGWTYNGNTTPGEVIPPWEKVEPFGFGTVVIRDLLYGIYRKYTEGAR